LDKNKDIPYDLPQIEKMINKLNDEIQQSSNLTLKEEKQKVKRIHELEALKPLLPAAQN